ncbi:MAG: hypothetical protein GWN00_19525 [Aliifodinibius sp.]|nr:hypothetical protein [Fodinibius sp.]NIY26915.1 hypothetical protein [Fodinibius sp.]
MASFVKVNDFVEHLAEQTHDLANDTLEVALSNTAPGSETSNPLNDGNGVLTNVTQISYTNLSSRVITTNSSSQTGGTYSLVLNDLVLTASGAVDTFRYVYIFNQDATSPADALIAHYDYGSAVTLADQETFTIDFGTELFTLS